MNVDMWMTTEPTTIGPYTTVAEAAVIMARGQVRRLLVVGPGAGGPRLMGIVSERDVARAFPANVNPNAAFVPENVAPQPVTTVMARDLLTTTPETPIEEAAHVMRTRRVGALPVVRGDRLVGIITESDVFRAFVEISGAERAGLRVTFELIDDEDVAEAMLELCREHGLVLTSLLAFHHADRRSGERRRIAVARLEGAASDAVLDAIWKAHNRVLAVVRSGAMGQAA
jgi:acetoin utilization protein AcuB